MTNKKNGEIFNLGTLTFRAFTEKLAAHGVNRYESYDLIARNGQLVTLRFKINRTTGVSPEAAAVLAKLEQP